MLRQALRAARRARRMSAKSCRLEAFTYLARPRRACLACLSIEQNVAILAGFALAALVRRLSCIFPWRASPANGRSAPVVRANSNSLQRPDHDGRQNSWASPFTALSATPPAKSLSLRCNILARAARCPFWSTTRQVAF